MVSIMKIWKIILAVLTIVAGIVLFDEAGLVLNKVRLASAFGADVGSIVMYAGYIVSILYIIISILFLVYLNKKDNKGEKIIIVLSIIAFIFSFLGPKLFEDLQFLSFCAILCLITATVSFFNNKKSQSGLADLKQHCPYCGAVLNDDSLFCTKCGKELPKRIACPHCGASMNEGDAFCPNCGKSINEVSAEHSEEQESQQASDVSEKSTSKKYLPIIGGVIVLAILGGGWWSYKSSMEKKNVNLDSLFTVNLEEVKEDVEGNDTELIKDAYASVLKKYNPNTEWDDYGTYFLYDITGDNIPELWVYADEGSDSNFHIYTFKDKQAISIYQDSLEPSRTSFMNGKSGIYISTGGMGYEEWNLFKYENGKIVKKEVYSWSQNPANYEEVEESGVKPECEDIKTYKLKDKTPLDKI